MNANRVVALLIGLGVAVSAVTLYAAQNETQYEVLDDGSVLTTEVVDGIREVTGVRYGVWIGDEHHVLREVGEAYVGPVPVPVKSESFGWYPCGNVPGGHACEGEPMPAPCGNASYEEHASSGPASWHEMPDPC